MNDLRQLHIGIDGRKFETNTHRAPVDLLQRCAAVGRAGVFFRTLLDVSPTLDRGVLHDVRDAATDLGLYLEVGFGHLNPFNSPEDNEVRACGEGDYLLGAERIIKTAAEIGCHRLWASLASYQDSAWGLRAIDRFRTDITWPEQLEMSARTFGRIAPALREHASALALETHEEVTSHELLWMADRVGSDVVRVTFDPANSILRGEDPHEVARRIAPLTAKTHLRDVTVDDMDGVLYRRLAPCGEGSLDWRRILRTLLAANPELNLTIENATDGSLAPMYFDDERWRGSHPQLDPVELDTIRSWRTEREAVRSAENRTLSDEEQADFVSQSALGLETAWSSLDTV